MLFFPSLLPSISAIASAGKKKITLTPHSFHFTFLAISQKNNTERRQTLSEPSGLENMLLTAQMESLCDQATEAATDSTARLYFVNDLLRK